MVEGMLYRIISQKKMRKGEVFVNKTLKSIGKMFQKQKTRKNMGFQAANPCNQGRTYV